MLNHQILYRNDSHDLLKSSDEYDHKSSGQSSRNTSRHNSRGAPLKASFINLFQQQQQISGQTTSTPSINGSRDPLDIHPDRREMFLQGIEPSTRQSFILGTTSIDDHDKPNPPEESMDPNQDSSSVFLNRTFDDSVDSTDSMDMNQMKPLQVFGHKRRGSAMILNHDPSAISDSLSLSFDQTTSASRSESYAFAFNLPKVTQSKVCFTPLLPLCIPSKSSL